MKKLVAYCDVLASPVWPANAHLGHLGPDLQKPPCSMGCTSTSSQSSGNKTCQTARLVSSLASCLPS